MLGTDLFYLSLVAIAVLVATPALAVEPDSVWDVCEQYLLSDDDDSMYEEECLSGLAQISPPVNNEAVEERRRSRIPIGKPIPVQTSVDDDRELLAALIESGEGVDVIVEFDAWDIRTEANSRALDRGLASLSSEEVAYKRAEYARLKEDGLADLRGITVLRELENLSTSFVHVSDEAALDALLARPEVRAVYENKELEPFLNESLPLINQPAVAAAGNGGAGTTIAVLDTGVNFTLAAFGSCTSPGIPAGCRVVSTLEAAANDFSLDDSGHGTNVSAIAAGTAGEADLVVADVFGPTGAAIVDIQTAINWAIAIQPTFNIVAMNLSLGNPFVVHTTHCAGDPLDTALDDALAVGIQPIVSAGNSATLFGTFQDGIASPACVPAAVSVGAVYDDNVGSFSWNGGGTFDCLDPTTAADQVGCFSQTAPILSLLAPGAEITAGGFIGSGTSQAAPHVAGAWAILSAELPTAPEPLLLATLQDATTMGVAIVDTRPDPDRTTTRLRFVPEPSQTLLLASGIVGLVVLRKRVG